jgi:SAM-dependent methyltransferase
MTLTPTWDQLDRDCELLPEELRHRSRRYLKNHQQRYESDLRLVERFYRGGRVLEIGAAPCQLIRALQLQGYPVQAVDLNPDRFLPIIRKYALPVVQCDIEREPLPFERARFSLILFNEVFEHLRMDPIATLAEIHRVLRPGGSLVPSTPNLYSLKSIASFLRGRGFGDPYQEFQKLHSLGHMGHVRVYTADQIKRFLAGAGLQSIEVRYRFHKSRRRVLGLAMNLANQIFLKCRPYQVHISTAG